MTRIHPHVAYSLVLSMLFQGSWTLRCYDCFNLDAKDDSSGYVSTFISTITSGESTFDPNCGNSPSSSKTMTCGNGEVCGAIRGDLSAQVPLIGTVHVGVQVRTCIPATDGPIGSCEKVDATIKKIIEDALSFATALLATFSVDGKMCACDTDLCALDFCDEGVLIHQFCVQNWIIGVSVAAAVVVLILLITCCCCCCGCCKRSPSSTVMMLPPATPYGMQTTAVVSSSQSQSAQGYGYPVQSYSPGYSGSSTGQNDYNPGGYTNGPPNYKDPTNAGYNQAV